MINEGGPAFPNKDHMGDGPNGMTLRDYFAAKAIDVAFQTVKLRADESWPMAYARTAYEIADAMIKERDK